MFILTQSLTASDVAVVVVDLVGLEEVLELLHHRIVDFEVFGDGVGGQVVLAEVEEGVVNKETLLKGIQLQVVDLFVGVMPRRRRRFGRSR